MVFIVMNQWFTSSNFNLKQGRYVMYFIAIRI